MGDRLGPPQAAGQAVPEQGAIGQSGAGRSGAGQSGAVQSGAGPSGAAQSGAGQSGAGQSIGDRVTALDWDRIDGELDRHGVARLGRLLSAAECRTLAELYDGDGFRSRVVMARHGFGSGEYRYFSAPLPPLVTDLRERVYREAVRTADRWAGRLALPPFPATLEEMLGRCHDAGQDKPTPLLLKYGPGDYNCLHQDIYGAVAFPLQLVVMLSDPADFCGGEFVVTEQRPRMQSSAEVVTPAQGEGVLFATAERPRRGTKGDYRVKLRHGVSRVRSGERMTLGVIFHDAA